MQVTVSFDSRDGDIGTNIAMLASIFGANTIPDAPVFDRTIIKRMGIDPKNLTSDEGTSGFAAKIKHEGDKPKRHRRTKAELEAARTNAVRAKSRGELHEQDEDKDVNAEFESEDVSEQPDDFDLGEGTPEVVLSLEGDIIPAFQAYSKKHGREKAGAILKKFFKDKETASVRALPTEKYPEVMEALA